MRQVEVIWGVVGKVTDGEGFSCAGSFEKMDDPREADWMGCRDASKSCVDEVW